MSAKSRSNHLLRYLAATTLIAVSAGAIAAACHFWESARRVVTLESVAASSLANGRPLDAAILYEEPLLKGVAWYRAGRYERAASAFSTVAHNDIALYNLGVTLARLSRFDDAIDAFNQLLARDPLHVDARHNLALLRSIDRALEPDNPEQSGPPQDGDIQQTHDGGAESQMQAAEEPIATNEQAKDKDDRPRSDPDQQENIASLGGSGQSESGRKHRIEHRASETVQPVDPAAKKAGAQAEDQNQQERSGERSSTESALSEKIMIRKLVDDPALVLRARLESAARSRAAAIK